jgi:oligopeptide/dipeptide ABC transporter ATP-binding protein
MFNGQFVEYGPAERVFHQPEHPYTKKLLSAIPHLEHHTAPLTS